MEEAVQTSAFTYVLIGAPMFSFFVNVTGTPDIVVRVIADLDIAPVAVIALLLAVYLALGCVMDSFGVITLPAVVPLDLDYSLVWWGIVTMIVTGLITPPFGISMFVLRSVAPDVPLATVYQGVVPFVVADIAELAFIVLFPVLSVWLPSTMFNWANVLPPEPQEGNG